MKLCVITDTHAGVRNDNKSLKAKQEEFYTNVFFPYLEENDIGVVLHLGDLFDRRKYINFETLSWWNRVFMDRLNSMGIECHFIAGNHDTYHRSSNNINSLRELYSGANYPNMNFYWEKPVELNFGSSKIMLCPWLSPENTEESMKLIDETDATILMGHFGITGFSMGRGQLCDDGLDADLFSKFHSVFSGHFHTKSVGKNITYLGAPYQMTWVDYGDKKGFHIFDTETLEMEFIENPYNSFQKIKYEDSDLTFDQIVELDVSMLTNSFVKVIMINKTNGYLFDRFIDKLNSVTLADLKIVDDNKNMDLVNVETFIDETQSTEVILRNYVDSLDINVDKMKLNSFLQKLYTEALNLE